MCISLLVERFPTKVICVCNRDKPWFYGDCRHAFDLKQEDHLRWTRDFSGINWDEFVNCWRRSNEVYAEAVPQFRVRSRDVVMNAQLHHKWWSSLKSAVFGSSSDSSLPLIRGR